MVRALFNQKIPLMNVIETNKSLAKRRWLQATVSNIPMIHQKVIQRHTNSLEINWPLRHWVQDSKNKIILSLRNMPNNYSAHKRAPINHHALRARRQERCRINKAKKPWRAAKRGQGTVAPIGVFSSQKT